MLYCNYDATTMAMIQYTDEDDGKRIKLITRSLGYKGQASSFYNEIPEPVCKIQSGINLDDPFKI